MIPIIGSKSGALSTTAATIRHVSRRSLRSSASTIAWSRYGGGVATVWLATAILVPELANISRRGYRATIAATAIGSFMATWLIGFGLPAAAPLAIVNIGEAMIIAALLRRFGKNDTYLDSLEGFAVFALATAIGTAMAATAGAAIAALIGHTDGLAAWHKWLAGHALGVLTFAPVTSLLLNGEFKRWTAGGDARQRIEATLLLGLLAGVCLIVFNTGQLAILFVPILPLMVVTFRLDRPGAAMGIVILAVIGAMLTLLGRGPVHLVGTLPGLDVQILQAYLAVTALTVLPVAAELRQRRDIFRRLLESEARYKLITESASDIIISLDLTGVVRYASPSVEEITGFPSHRLIGKRPGDLIRGPHRDTVIAAYRQAFDNPGSTALVEYQTQIVSGQTRWFEANIRSVLDDNGVPCGVVSATRDISERKALELKLAHAATTDPLTGLANRRKFDALLDRKIEERRAGISRTCIAIFDIDYFKAVNDIHGHTVGDLVLETFAAAALRVLRAGDQIARLGGEEFGLILNGAGIEQASRICDRLREAVARDITRTPSGAEVSITVSAGIAEVTGKTSRLQLMHAADEALYRAKAGGRDRLAFAA